MHEEYFYSELHCSAYILQSLERALNKSSVKKIEALLQPTAQKLKWKSSKKNRSQSLLMLSRNLSTPQFTLTQLLKTFAFKTIYFRFIFERVNLLVKESGFLEVVLFASVHKN